MDDLIFIDDALDDLSDGQMLIITFRAAKRAGVEVEWSPEGTLAFEEPTEDLADNEEFLEAWEHEACLFVAALTTARMVAEGTLYVSGIALDGQHEYSVVPGAEIED